MLNNLLRTVAFATILLSTSPISSAATSGFLIENPDRTGNPNLRLIETGTITSGETWNIQLTPLATRPVFVAKIDLSHPAKGIDHLSLGRIIPTFGRESGLRLDQARGGVFSPINAPLVTTDTGFQIDGTAGRLSWTAGAFAGYRLDGDVPHGKNGQPDYYGRAVYAATPYLELGASQRLGASPCSGADADYHCGRSEISLETIGHNKTLPWSALYEYHPCRSLWLDMRYEYPRAVSVGTNLQIGHTLEIQAHVTQSGQTGCQLVCRW